MFESVRQTNQILNELGFSEVNDVEIEPLNIEYESCLFYIDQKKYRSRRAKKTPNKKGYFTVFWIKDDNNKNRPYNWEETPGKIIITFIDEDKKGQFIFPKEVLAERNIITTDDKKGKMALRVYPPFENSLNKTAEQTQKWQSDYFIDLTDSINKTKFSELY